MIDDINRLWWLWIFQIGRWFRHNAFRWASAKSHRFGTTWPRVIVLPRGSSTCGAEPIYGVSNWWVTTMEQPCTAWHGYNPAKWWRTTCWETGNSWRLWCSKPGRPFRRFGKHTQLGHFRKSRNLSAIIDTNHLKEIGLYTNPKPLARNPAMCQPSHPCRDKYKKSPSSRALSYAPPRPYHPIWLTLSTAPHFPPPPPTATHMPLVKSVNYPKQEDNKQYWTRTNP